MLQLCDFPTHICLISKEMDNWIHGKATIKLKPSTTLPLNKSKSRLLACLCSGLKSKPSPAKMKQGCKKRSLDLQSYQNVYRLYCARNHATKQRESLSNEYEVQISLSAQAF